MIWTFDFELVDQELDWVARSKSYGFWKKPQLQVKFRRRAEVGAGSEFQKS